MIILDLCGGTGAWSKPYQDAGYDVRVITLPEQDVRGFRPPEGERVHGILAAPPCDHFAGSGAQYWKAKDGDGRTLDALSIVDACIRIIHVTKPVWWCLENPVGRLRYWLGPPVMYFDPCDYGDPYTKKTGLWGRFREPVKNPVEPTLGSRIVQMSSSWKVQRSVTPPGFARAFFEANP